MKMRKLAIFLAMYIVCNHTQAGNITQLKVSSRDSSKTNPLMWSILRQLERLETKVEKVQDDTAKLNEHILKVEHRSNCNQIDIQEINKSILDIKQQKRITDKKISECKGHVAQQQCQTSKNAINDIIEIKRHIEELQHRYQNDTDMEEKIQQIESRIAELQDKDNDTKKRLVEITDKITALQQLHLRTSCGSEWKEWHGHCYFIAQKTLSWHDAKKDCELMKSYLVKVDTAEENTMLWTAVNAMGVKLRSLWNGANESGGNWVWASDATPLKYSNWYPKQPSGGEPCLEMYLEHSFQWNDINCDYQIGYICEKSLWVNTSQDCRIYCSED